MHRFRTPELFLGCFLTVAVFATGLLFVHWQQPGNATQTVKEQAAPGEGRKAENPDSELTGTTWLTKDAAGFFTFGLVVIGVGQALLFFVQLRYMRQGMEDATTSARAARDGAHAARDSADVSKLAMTAGQRAYVHYHGCRWISHVSTVDGSIFWRIRPCWTNAGNTPARKTKVYAHYELLDAPLPDDYPFQPDSVTAVEGMIAAKGLIESGPRDIAGTDLLDVAEGRKHLYIWGTITYRDVFPDTPERITKFCVFASNITGDPKLAWDATTNQFDMAFMGYARHNCMDEDC
jgi:hypothetical protein